MSSGHRIPVLPFPIETRALHPGGLRVRAPDAPVADFALVSLSSVTAKTAEELTHQPTPGRPLLVAYARATADARRLLRDAGISYIGDDGRAFLKAPGLYIDRDDRVEHPHPHLHSWGPTGVAASNTSNPFATRGSRVPRWLLLHHEEAHTVGEIAEAVSLSGPVVSRVLRALYEAALINSSPAKDARRREVILTRPRELLEAWLPVWQRRRTPRQLWDIGATNADEALGILTNLAERLPPRGWAIGGIAGAAKLRKAVEPADVLVWVDPDDTAEIRDVVGAEPVRDDRPIQGSLQIREARDPWVFRLADQDEVPVADAVQLWLDCASSGERGLEAAEAVAETMHW